jgi:hypothetical protein
MGRLRWKILFAIAILLVTVSVAIAEVYVTRTGAKYHLRTSCRGLNRAKSIQSVSLETALTRGLDPCAICASGSGSAARRRTSVRTPRVQVPPSAPIPFAPEPASGVDTLDRLIGRLNSSLIDQSELSRLSGPQLRILRNAVFARRGYVFRSADLKMYFSSKPWYNPTERSMDTVSRRLSPTEQANLRCIMATESRT